MRRLAERGGRYLSALAHLKSPRNLWIATALAVFTAVALDLWIMPALRGSDESVPDKLVTEPSATRATEVAVSAASNPLPNVGFPHGRGITKTDFPEGYRFRGAPRPTFDSYVEGLSSEFSDERHFLWACFLNEETDGCLVRTGRSPRGRLEVAPGDRLLISALIDNNGDPSGNRDGAGPAVAHDTRVSFAFPTDRRGTVLDLSSYVYAADAIVDESRPALKTISDNFGFRSATGKPIELKYLGGARILQVMRSVASAEPGSTGYVYRRWILTGDQQRMLFTGSRRNVEGNTEADPGLGLPIGSTGSPESLDVVGTSQDDELDFYAGPDFHMFAQFEVRVEGSW
jgi:hypothetical protein